MSATSSVVDLSAERGAAAGDRSLDGLSGVVVLLPRRPVPPGWGGAAVLLDVVVGLAVQRWLMLIS